MRKKKKNLPCQYQLGHWRDLCNIATSDQYISMSGLKYQLSVRPCPLPSTDMDTDNLVG